MSERAQVLVMYTGGTIGMQRTERGYAPAPGLLGRQLTRMPMFQDPALPRGTMPLSKFGRHVSWRLKEYSPLLDSSNMDMSDWVRLAEEVERFYDAYDAFVILHGTDTMAYSASALSFMLRNLGKPVVMTGSQIPLVETRNDALDNLLGALTIAGHFHIPEVTLYFHHKLMRGNRTRKMDASGLDAFQSTNLPPLAEVGTGIDVAWHRVRRMPRAPLIVRPITERNVASLRIFPGITAEIMQNFLQPPLRGVVLETYGSGNVPDIRPDFLDALRRATDAGIVVVNCTQCPMGAVSPDYVGGKALADAGVVGGADMTPEAALTKLSYLLSRSELSTDEVRRWMTTDLRGEMTPPAAEPRFDFADSRFVRSVASALAPGESQLEARWQVNQALLPVVLCAAAGHGDLATVQALLDEGAAPDAADYDGRTPLHVAAARGQLEMCRFLIGQGADLTARDRWGHLALDDARRGGFAAVATMLAGAGQVSEADDRMEPVSARPFEKK